MQCTLLTDTTWGQSSGQREGQQTVVESNERIISTKVQCMLNLFRLQVRCRSLSLTCTSPMRVDRIDPRLHRKKTSLAWEYVNFLLRQLESTMPTNDAHERSKRTFFLPNRSTLFVETSILAISRRACLKKGGYLSNASSFFSHSRDSTSFVQLDTTWSELLCLSTSIPSPLLC